MDGNLIDVPPGYEDLPLEEVQAHFRRLLDARLAEIHAEREAAGLSYMGPEAVLAQDRNGSAGDSIPTFDTTPRTACDDFETRIRVLRDLKAFRAAYRKAYARYVAGDREVKFPLGTYLYPARFGARVAGVPP